MTIDNNNEYVNLNKAWFKLPLFWSTKDGESVRIETIITKYAQRPIKEDAQKLVELFGRNRVLKIAKKNLSAINFLHFKEMLEVQCEDINQDMILD